jgi:hypothetical protein
MSYTFVGCCSCGKELKKGTKVYTYAHEDISGNDFFCSVFCFKIRKLRGVYEEKYFRDYNSKVVC